MLIGVLVLFGLVARYAVRHARTDGAADAPACAARRARHERAC